MKEADRILKMHKNANGMIKYKIKWKGFDETTWESEDAVKKFKELLDDFNHFLVTGERYDEKKLESLRAQYNIQPTSKPPSKPQSVHGINRAVKVARAPKNYPIEEQQSKKDKKNDKLDGKIIENNSIENQKQVIQQQSEMNKTISLQNHQNILNCNTSGQKGIQILAQKQQEVIKYIAGQYANQTDRIESITLELTQDQCVFKVSWRKRVDNNIPYPQFYSLEQFKLLFPLLYIQYIEVSILECESKDSEIQFIGPGIDCYERTDLIRNRLEQQVQIQEYEQLQQQ